MDRRFYFVADDFGLDARTNEAILYSHQQGVLDSTCLMMGQSGTEEAVQQARANPGLSIGFHLHLCDSKPLSVGDWPWGESPSRAGWSIGLSARARELAAREIRLQWQAFQEAGLPCAFVNCHHHLHAHPWVYRELCRVIEGQCKGWIRLGSPRFFGKTHFVRGGPVDWWMGRRRAGSVYASPDTLWGIDRIFCMRAVEVQREIRTLTSGVHEFMFHPRRLKKDPDTECLIELKQRPLGL